MTGALCIGAACCIPGSIAHRHARRSDADAAVIAIEHPAGRLETRMATRPEPGSAVPVFERAGIVRTARPLFAGVVHLADDEGLL